jgi:WD40 repeat protein
MGNQLSLWDVNTGQLIGEWSASEDQANDKKIFLWGLAFSPDGSQLAAGDSGGMITVWQTDSGQMRKRFQAHDRAVTSLAFSLDGERLASGGLDGVLRIWNRDLP